MNLLYPSMPVSDEVKGDHAAVVDRAFFYKFRPFASAVRVSVSTSPVSLRFRLSSSSGSSVSIRIIFSTNDGSFSPSITCISLSAGERSSTHCGGRLVKRSVDDVSPFDKFGKRFVDKPEFLFGDSGDKLGARCALLYRGISCRTCRPKSAARPTRTKTPIGDDRTTTSAVRRGNT